MFYDTDLEKIPKARATLRSKQLSDVDVLSLRVTGRLARRRLRFTLIDLFSGAGGLTLGFTGEFGHNFRPIWANDNCEYAAKTYNYNFGHHCICGDILDLMQSEEISIPLANIVIGGPPCQGFSLLNRNRKLDPRRQLWRPYFEMVERSKADIFLMENVPQLLGSDEHREILGVAAELGFVVKSEKLCAADYGVPQVRYRAFILGSRIGDPSRVFPPKATHSRPNGDGNNDFFHSNLQPWATVRKAIEDLPSPDGTELRFEDPPLDLHFGRTPTPKSLMRYKSIPMQGMNRFDLQKAAPHLTPNCWIKKKSGGTDLFGRLWWDRPAFTIRTEFFKPEKGRYLHPRQHRPITHREAARLQSFPDEFRFKGTKIEIAKQIGNAVPPLLASRVADSVYALLHAHYYKG